MVICVQYLNGCKHGTECVCYVQSLLQCLLIQTVKMCTVDIVECTGFLIVYCICLCTMYSVNSYVQYKDCKRVWCLNTAGYCLRYRGGLYSHIDFHPPASSSSYLSNYLTSSSYLSNYLTSSSYISNYQTSSSYLSNYLTSSSYLSNYLTSSSYISNYLNYLTSYSYLSNYLTSSCYLSIYLTNSCYLSI